MLGQLPKGGEVNDIPNIPKEFPPVGYFPEVKNCKFMIKLLAMRLDPDVRKTQVQRS